MGYALFAQQKVSLTGQVNSLSLQQTQRSNEQNVLATQKLSLQQKLSEMQASQSLELSELYQLLSNINSAGAFDDEFLLTTGVAVTKGSGDEKKVVKNDDGSIKLNEKSDGTLKQTSADLVLSGDALQLMDQILDDYNKNVGAGKNTASDAREAINAKIKAKQSKFDSELADINNEIYLTGVKENAIEMEVKRLDTALTSAQKRLESVEEAEGKGIEKATPKFQGVG